MQTKTRYAVRDRKSGDLLGIYRSSNEGQDFCGEFSAVFTRDNLNPVLFPNEDSIVRAITNNPPWFNSDEETPMWGEFKQEDFEVVEVTISYKDRPDIKPIIDLSRVDLGEVNGVTHLFDRPASQSNFEPKYGGRLVFYGPIDKDKAEKFVGRDVNFGGIYRRHVLGVQELKGHEPGEFFIVFENH